MISVKHGRKEVLVCAWGSREEKPQALMSLAHFEKHVSVFFWCSEHNLSFCLRRSPDHGTVDVVVVLLLLLLLLGGTTLVFHFFQDTEIFLE